VTGVTGVTGVAGPLLAVRDLRVRYGPALALDGVSFDVDDGEVVAVVGANGAGKSTLLRTVSGLRAVGQHVEGSIEVAGRAVGRWGAHRVARLGLAHVPEGRGLFPSCTVEDNLLLGAYAHRNDRARWEADLDAVYRRFPLLADRQRRRAGPLTGGEQQVLAIGRALMARPRLLLLDEPSAGLAPKLVSEVFATIRALADEGVTILLVEQLANLALRVAGRAYLLEAGRVTATGSAAALADDPRVRAAFLGV
jgi:branched-chain amino acid transport system ATP-binding protein